jgi:hypothetical protein
MVAMTIKKLMILFPMVNPTDVQVIYHCTHAFASSMFVDGESTKVTVGVVSDIHHQFGISKNQLCISSSIFIYATENHTLMMWTNSGVLDRGCISPFI